MPEEDTEYMERFHAALMDVIMTSATKSLLS